MTEFKVSVRAELGDVRVIDLNGYLDAHTAPELESAFDNLITDKNYRVVVNFRDLTYISSAGLGVFMAFVEPMRENQGDIKFSNMTENVYNIFDLLGFPMLYEVYDDEREAIDKYNQKGDSESEKV